MVVSSLGPGGGTGCSCETRGVRLGTPTAVGSVTFVIDAIDYNVKIINHKTA